MINILRSTSIIYLLVALSGCSLEMIEEESSEAAILEDATEQDVTDALLSDGLIPPTAPELSISSAPGILQFSWTNNDDSGEPITSARLLQYDARTDIETDLSVGLEPNMTQLDLPIAPHQLAWDTLSYRIETCTNTNCLSSLRMPIDSLLADALDVVQPSNADDFPSYGSHMATNATGNVALVANPQGNNATVLMRPAKDWILASTLAPSQIEQTSDAELRVAASSTGDTLAVAFVSANTNPQIAIFDRLGEAWIETDAIDVFGGNQLSDLTRTWDTQSLQLQLSSDGDRLAIGAQQLNRSSNSRDQEIDSQVAIYERGSLNWSLTNTLSVPNLHTRLRSFSGSANLTTIVALSTSNSALYLNEYQLNNTVWQTTATQLLDNIAPAIDSLVVSASNGSGVTIASWETDTDGARAPVAWRLERRSAGWVAIDSVRQSGIANSTAQLRLATDATQNSMALGWQASSLANLSFYSQQESQWQRLFAIPRALSVAFSSDNAIALVGAAGGFLSFGSAD